MVGAGGAGVVSPLFLPRKRNRGPRPPARQIITTVVTRFGRSFILRMPELQPPEWNLDARQASRLIDVPLAGPLVVPSMPEAQRSRESVPVEPGGLSGVRIDTRSRRVLVRP